MKTFLSENINLNNINLNNININNTNHTYNTKDCLYLYKTIWNIQAKILKRVRYTNANLTNFTNANTNNINDNTNDNINDNTNEISKINYHKRFFNFFMNLHDQSKNISEAREQFEKSDANIFILRMTTYLIKYSHRNFFNFDAHAWNIIINKSKHEIIINDAGGFIKKYSDVITSFVHEITGDSYTVIIPQLTCIDIQAKTGDYYCTIWTLFLTHMYLINEHISYYDLFNMLSDSSKSEMLKIIKQYGIFILYLFKRRKHIMNSIRGKTVKSLLPPGGGVEEHKNSN